MNTYFRNIKDAFTTMSEGLRLTLRYLMEARNSRDPIGVEHADYFKQDKGIVTLQYPRESFPVPDNGRYRLHNEIDDCIVCDKCAKICPVDCIEIDAIKSPAAYGVTSDGTPKRIHAAKFDIDMGKCCFCGLCTTVCPTECLTMTKVYDFSEFEIENHVYSFAEMSLVEIAQKRKELEAYEEQKARAAQKPTKEEGAEDSAERATSPKPNAGAAKPVMKAKPKVGAKPVMKPKVVPSPTELKQEEKEEIKEPKPKPKFRPKPMIKRKPKTDGDE